MIFTAPPASEAVFPKAQWCPLSCRPLTCKGGYREKYLVFLTVKATGTGNIEMQSRQNQAQGCPQVFAVTLTEDRSLARLGTNPHANHSAWKATVHQATWERRSIARIYINAVQTGRIQGTGTGKESVENIRRKMRIPPTYGRACRSRHDCFHFSWKDGGGRRKEGEKGVSFQKFAKHLLLVFSLQGMDNFQKLDHTEARVWSCKSLCTWITLPHMSSHTGRTKIFTVPPFSFIKWVIANTEQGHTELNLASDT